MKTILIDNKSKVRSVLLWLNVLVFSCASCLYSMQGTSNLPSSFPTEPVSPEGGGVKVEGGARPSGPETVAIFDEKSGEQGNWVKKKQWLLKAYEVNNNIYSLALQIADTRNLYSTKNDAISDEFQTFYRNLGLQQGKLQSLFESVERYLEKKKKSDITAVTGGEKQSEPDRDYQIKIELIDNQIKQLKDELEQLKLDMKSIEDIGRSLTQRLEKVDEQIVAAMNLAESAKNKVEDLWEIIDDKKARIIYYDLANIEENLKVILTYLSQTLAGDFDTVIQNAKKQIQVTNDGVKKLENKGLIIKDRSSRIEQLKLQELKKIEEDKSKAEHPVKPVAEKKVTSDKSKNVGWWEAFYNYCVDIYIKIYKYFLHIKKTSTINKIIIENPSQQPATVNSVNLPQVQMATEPASSAESITSSQSGAVQVSATPTMPLIQ